MEDFNLNEKKITQKEWKEYLAFKEEYQENEAEHNLLLQNINDTLEGGIRSANLKEYRNTYIINAQDSLDDSYPMYVHFNIISEMTKIVSVKMSFWFLNFRAYSTGAASGGGQTSSSVITPSGGGQTSGATGSASGGGATSGANNDHTSLENPGLAGSSTDIEVYPLYVDAATGATLFVEKSSAGTKTVWGLDHYHTLSNHTHTTPDHTHPDHTHTIADHTHPAHAHTVANHTHNITYGIFEDSTSPTILPYISKDNGKSYSLPIGSYTADHENLDITSYFGTAGSKLIKFTSNARTRLSVQINIKLDISAR